MTESTKMTYGVSESALIGPAIPEYPAMPDVSDFEQRATSVTITAIACQMTRALTALLIDVIEIKDCRKEHLSPPEMGSLQDVLRNALHQAELARATLRQSNVARHVPVRGGEVLSHRRRRYASGTAIMLSETERMPLTAREREVLILICEGCTTKQGARQMQIGPRTFESHRSEVMRKLGARNAADLVRMCLLRSNDNRACRCYPTCSS